MPQENNATAGGTNPAETTDVVAAADSVMAADESPVRTEKSTEKTTAKTSVRAARKKKTTTTRATAKKSTAKKTKASGQVAGGDTAETKTTADVIDVSEVPDQAGVSQRRTSGEEDVDPADLLTPSGEESSYVEERASAVVVQRPAFDATPLFAAPDPTAIRLTTTSPTSDAAASDEGRSSDGEDGEEGENSRRRRRRRGGRGRRRRPDEATETAEATTEDLSTAADLSQEDSVQTDVTTAEHVDADESPEDDEIGGSRRRRRRRRKSDADIDQTHPDDPPNTVVKVRDARETDDEVTSVKGSTRLEAKKQRRREGREAGRRRPPILSEAEFLARREAVERVMAVREDGDLTQIAVLEDNVLVEHYVSRASQQSLIGNVYLGRVQNVLPAMEAAFVDIGRGRNAVLYAGEVDWSGFGQAEGPKRIEDVLKSGQSVLVQVTKDPIAHKGARLTSQISLPGRYVVYVPGGTMNGISRKLPDTERGRLKKILKQVVPEDAGVIVRTAAEGASEEELTNDVARLRAEWDAIARKTSGNAPALLHGEPDLATKVVRDLFNEDFTRLVVHGDQVWSTIDDYITHVASSLRDRVEKWTGPKDVFSDYRIDEQIAKAMDRKVWLPSGGSLVIDRTEAMTVVDVNTGKFTGSGGNLEETVTKNNLEAAEEIVRQLRLRDIGGIIVIDFIDMVLEANRDLVLRRLVECLGRDRTKHQVAEVTSLGLVQMTRKRIGTGLLEAFSEPCPQCKGRGLLIHVHAAHAEGATDPDTSGLVGSRTERRGRRHTRDQLAPATVTDAVSPKLEASAEPGDASPADLVPAARDGNASGSNESEVTDEHPGSESAADEAQALASGGSSWEGDTGIRSSTNDGGSSVGMQPDSVRDKPAGRTRRRARRPEGSPDPGNPGKGSPDPRNPGEGSPGLGGPSNGGSREGSLRSENPSEQSPRSLPSEEAAASQPATT
jgi:ribonuclease E